MKTGPTLSTFWLNQQTKSHVQQRRINKPAEIAE